MLSKSARKKWPFPKEIIFLPLLLFVIGLSYVLSQQYTPFLAKTITYQEYNKGPQTPIDQWNTYTNPIYGLSLQYPRQGYVQDPKCFTEGTCTKLHLASCGSDIKETNVGKDKLITVDNMLGIVIKKYPYTITNYLRNIGVLNTYETTPVIVQGATEAVFVSKVKPGITVDIPAIPVPSLLIKHGEYVFQVAGIQNPGSKTGCLLPAGATTGLFTATYWNIAQSVSFKNR